MTDYRIGDKVTYFSYMSNNLIYGVIIDKIPYHSNLGDWLVTSEDTGAVLVKESEMSKVTNA